jgi:hypothetical protein
MPFFSLLCLFFAFFVDGNSALQKYFAQDFVLYLGLLMASGVIVACFFKKIPEMASYDAFCCGTLLAWFAYWKPLFTHDSPIFFFFPVYFALISALAALFFTSQRKKINLSDLGIMREIDRSGAANPSMLMCLVLITLYFENHFLQFPIMMTLLITRYVLSGCLRNNPHLRKLDFMS